MPGIEVPLSYGKASGSLEYCAELSIISPVVALKRV